MSYGADDISNTSGLAIESTPITKPSITKSSGALFHGNANMADQSSQSEVTALFHPWPALCPAGLARLQALARKLRFILR
jgi:hypothetical protein